jgi:hypothetical protein
MKTQGSGRHGAIAAALITVVFAATFGALGDAPRAVAASATAAPPNDDTGAGITGTISAPAPLATSPRANAAGAATGAPGAGAVTGPSTNTAGPAAPSEDIRDIRGPKFILPAWLVPALLAAAALLAAGVYAVWRRLQRRRRARVLLPFEVALQRLEDIRALMQPERAREFSTEASGIVRTYIEQRFDVTATHQTTEEFLRDLVESSHASLARHRALLSAFLHQCDLVKFAGMALTLQNMETLHESARTFVLETSKPEEVTDTDAPQAGKEAHDSLPTT